MSAMDRKRPCCRLFKQVYSYLCNALSLEEPVLADCVYYASSGEGIYVGQYEWLSLALGFVLGLLGFVFLLLDKVLAHLRDAQIKRLPRGRRLRA